MPYKDPDKQHEYVRNSRKHFCSPPSMEELPRQYYVVMRPHGLDITLYPQSEDSVLAGPMTLIAATDAYITAGGLEYDFED